MRASFYHRYLIEHALLEPLFEHDAEAYKKFASLSANNGKLMRDKIAEGLAETGKAVLKDARGGAAGWDDKPVRIKMKFPGLDDTQALDGMLLSQTDKTVVLSPKVNTISIFYGVSIIPRNEVELSPL